jgi:hypothetical protein
MDCMPCAFTSASGTSWAWAGMSNAASSSRVRSACGVLFPGGVSVGTRTSACRKRTCSSKWAST